tara:strand:+ start:752 stop:937 length:186 start_codon:yes stop_codon:yes gene_type:complete
MSKDIDMTPLQYQTARISFELSKVMEQLHILTEEVIALQQLAENITEMDTIDWGKGKRVPK